MDAAVALSWVNPSSLCLHPVDLANLVHPVFSSTPKSSSEFDAREDEMSGIGASSGL
jgi:hypothetical protein